MAEALTERETGGILPGHEVLEDLHHQLVAAARAALEFVRVVEVRDVVEAVREGERRAGPSPEGAPPRANMVEEGRGIGRRRGLRPRPCDEDARVVVRPPRKELHVWLGHGRRDPVAIGELRNHLRGERAEDVHGKRVDERVAGTVEAFEVLEKQDQLLELIEGEARIVLVEGVRHRVENSLLAKPCGEIHKVATDLLDLAVERLGETPCEDVHLAAVLGKIGGDLFANDHLPRVPRKEIERTGHLVMVGDGHEPHPCRPRPLPDRLRFRETFGRTDTPQDPFRRAVGMPRVDVEIHADGVFRRGRAAEIHVRHDAPQRNAPAPSRQATDGRRPSHVRNLILM